VYVSLDSRGLFPSFGKFVFSHPSLPKLLEEFRDNCADEFLEVSRADVSLELNIHLLIS